MWKKTLWAVAAAGYALSARAEAQSQEPPADTAGKPPAPKPGEPVQLDAITVQGTQDGLKAEDQSGATKMPLSLRETPQSVTVITRDALDERQVMTLGQALEMSAGVSQFTGNGPFAGQPSFGFNGTTIRGIAIDDIYDFRDDGFVSGSYFSIPDLAIYDRLEVVKGANSVLYGRGSVGGLINRIRKKPLAQASTDIELNVGSFDTYRADFDTTGPILGSSFARGRLTAAYEDSGSFVRGPETQRTVLAPSVDFDITSSTRLLLMGLYQSEDIIANTGTPLRPTSSGFQTPRISRHQYNGIVSKDPYTWDIRSVTAQLEQKLGDQWLATLRLNSSNVETPIKVDAYAYGFAEGDNPDTEVVERRGDTAVLGSEYFIDRDTWSGELQVVGSFDVAGHKVNASFGADHNESQYSRRGIYTGYSGFNAPDGRSNLYDGVFAPPNPDEVFEGSEFGGDPRATGYYAQAQIAATERLKVLLGARYDSVELRSFSGDTRSKDTKDKATGRAGVTYEVNDAVSVYSIYAQSFSPELYATDINGQLLKPETGEVFEGGIKTEWFARRLGVNAAVYRVDRDNIAIGVNDPDPTVTPYSISSGLQRSQGFEVEINGRPLPGWDISLAYNNVQAAFKDSDDPNYGTKPGGSASWQLGAFTTYEIQTGALKGLGFGVTAFAIADRGLGYITREQDPDNFVPQVIPGYTRFDVHASYKGFRNVDINLVVRNVTDEVYVEGADRNAGYAQFGSPTAAMLTLRYHLGPKGQ